MGALVVVFLWISINAIISYFEDRKEEKNEDKKIAIKKKSVIKASPKNYNFDLFYESGEQPCSRLKKSA